MAEWIQLSSEERNPATYQYNEGDRYPHNLEAGCQELSLTDAEVLALIKQIESRQAEKQSEYVLKEGEVLTITAGDRLIEVRLEDGKPYVGVDDMRIVRTYGYERLETIS